jgi:hypothetical protein
MEVRTALGIVAVVVYIVATLLPLTMIHDRSVAGWVAIGGLMAWPAVGAFLTR